MDWLTFWASVLGSVAWPMAAVAGVLLLRPSLARLMDKLESLKWGGVELAVAREVAKAEVEAGRGSQEAPPLGKDSSSPEASAPLGSLTYLTDLARLSPRAAIIEAWLPFEMAAARFGAGTRNPAPQMGEVISGLLREQLLTDGEAKAIRRLRTVRNRVVHGAEQISPTDAAEYVALLERITRRVEERAQTDETSARLARAVEP